MNKFDGILICSDIDGTLTNTDSEISKANLQAIEYFQNNGGKFTVSTGRFPNYLYQFLDVFMPNCPAIIGNGGVIYDYQNDKLISSKGFNCSSENLLNFVWNEMDKVSQLGICDLNGSIKNYIKHKDFDYDGSFNNTEFPKSYKEVQSTYKNNINDITRYFMVQKEEYVEENIAILQEKFGNEFELYKSWNGGTECLPKGVHKGNAVLEIKEMLENIHSVICVGDCDNDISMLEIADISYATENASDKVKSFAKHIAPHHNNDAIAYIINKI